MSDRTQTKDSENPNVEPVVNEIVEKPIDRPDSLEFQEVMKKRIEQVKKAFRPTWLIRQLDSQEIKKGK